MAHFTREGIATVNAIVDYQRNIQPPECGVQRSQRILGAFQGSPDGKAGNFYGQSHHSRCEGFGSLQYETSLPRSLKREALKKTASDARARAEVQAAEPGASLGNVTRISELSTGHAPLARGIMTAESTGGGTPVMSGELTVTAQAEVVFELK